MKKILLLGLVAIGMSAATMSARAIGFGFSVALSRPCPPICVGPVVPIVVPPPCVVGGCGPVVVHERFAPCGPERFHERVVERRDFRFHR